MRTFRPPLGLFAGLLVVVLLSSAFRAVTNTTGAVEATAVDIQWLDWNAAVAARKTEPKPLIIDVYTDWCGWCKRMDATTFKEPEVAAYIAKNFYAVKLNAEQRADINYDGHTFSYVRSNGRGYHELAQSLLDGRLEYPNFVYFNERMERVMISPGYKEPDALMKELKYVMGEGERP